MESLVKKMAQNTDQTSADQANADQTQQNAAVKEVAAAAHAGGPGSLLAAMQKATESGTHPVLQQANAQLNDATTKLTPGQFQDAASSAVSKLSPETTTALTKLLEKLGAPQTVDASAAAAGGSPETAKLVSMLHWVQTHVPGGIPAVLALLGGVGGAAVMGSGHGDDVTDAVSSSLNDVPGSHIVHSVLGALLPAIQGAVSKVSG